MNHSDSIAQLAAALSKAQASIQPAGKDAENPYHKSKYATLASVWAACREALTTNGLSVVQTPMMAEEGIMLVTTLLHESGEYISGEMPLDPVADKSGRITPQAVGSAMTYARRYALSAMVGVAPADDDDGNGASTPSPAHQRQPARKPKPKQTNGNQPFNEAAAIQWGLTKGVFNHENHARNSLANLRKDNPEATDEQLRQLWRDKVNSKLIDKQAAAESGDQDPDWDDLPSASA